MKLSHVLAGAAVAGAVGVAALVTPLAHAVDAEATPEKPAVTAKAETPKDAPKTDKVETAKGEALVQEEKPAFPEEKIKELKAEQDKAEAKAKEDKKADEKTPAKDTAKKPLPKTSAVK